MSHHEYCWYSCTIVGREDGLVLGSLLVDISRGRVLLLVNLVTKGILGSGGAVILC